MNEPKRWMEEGPPPAVERLLRAADAERPSDGSLHRVLSGLGVGLGATGAAASAGAAATVGTGAALASGAALATGKGALAVGVWAKWVVLSVATVGAGTAAVHQASVPTEKPRAAVSAAAPAPPVPVVAADPVVPAIAAPAPELETEEPPAVLRMKPAAPTPRPTAEVEAPLDAERLAEEVRAVDRARSALAEGRAAESLTALDEYEARFGGRKFAPEALYLRMQALLSLGRKAEARSAAERLVRAFPKSPHTARARRVLAEANP
jgi:hypothetical protein